MNDLEIFLSENAVDGGFLQSESWKEFQQSIGNRTLEIKNLEGGFYCLLCRRSLPLVGSYFFAARGPVIENSSSKIQSTNEGLNKLIKIAQREKAGWIRIEPQTFEELQVIEKSLKIEHKYRVIKSKKNHEPAQTLMLDLTLNEGEILGSMKQKTRYNIKVCGKKGVEIFESYDEEGFDDFYGIIEETARRNQVNFHPKKYYKKMIECADSGKMKLYLAKIENRIIAGILVSYYGKVATYLHGASSDKHRNLMAVYGLQWKAMQDAKNMGCEKYDLGGMSEATEKNKNLIIDWQGITRFKRGFCPNCEVVDFPGCWDIVLNNFKYSLYRTIQKIKN